MDTTFTFAVQGTALTGKIANTLTGVPAERPFETEKFRVTPSPSLFRMRNRAIRCFMPAVWATNSRMTGSGPSGRVYEFVAQRMK